MKKPLILWGGVDVSPALYGETPLTYTQHPNDTRDKEEIAAIDEAVANNIPVVGVCRGAQLLCVHNGGKLWQHTQPHRQNHSIETIDGRTFNSVSAGHHQIMNPTGTEHTVLAWNPAPTKVWINNEEVILASNMPEVVWFPKHKHLAIQPHPEWASKEDEFVIYVNKLMRALDIDYSF